MVNRLRWMSMATASEAQIDIDAIQGVAGNLVALVRRPTWPPRTTFDWSERCWLGEELLVRSNLFNDLVKSPPTGLVLVPNARDLGLGRLNLLHPVDCGGGIGSDVLIS